MHYTFFISNQAPIEFETYKPRIVNREQIIPPDSTLNAFADILPVIICEITLDMRIVYVNDLGLETFGYSQEDLDKGIYFKNLFPPAEFKRAVASMEKIIATGPSEQHNYQVQKKDGTPLHVLMNSAPIVRSGTTVGIRTCVVDISDRISAERKLAEIEQKFNAIHDLVPFGIAVLDASGFVVESNAAFNALWMKFYNTNIVGNSLFNQIKFSPQQIDSMTKSLESAGIIELPATSDNGFPGRFCQWRLIPLGDRFILTLEDVTEHGHSSLQVLDNATESSHTESQNDTPVLKHSQYNIISRSRRMRDIFELIPRIANADRTVLITGESGTGKELIARALHDAGSRRSKPFIAINCSALPDTLLESELFGSIHGAFTDAGKDRPGIFELARNGTLFLDEIADTSPAMQARLLRVLQERAFMPPGGTKPVQVTVRIIAATNKDLPTLIKKGAFRADLYYRIKVIKLSLPPLRERRCDIALLARHFLDASLPQYHKSINGISPEAMRLLSGYTFPGNIRELQNIIEQACVLCDDTQIQPHHIQLDAERETETDTRGPMLMAMAGQVEELKYRHIQEIIADSKGDKTLAAQQLGIHKTTLFRKLKRREE
jgi:PAS domain S-box-containing protein